MTLTKTKTDKPDFSFVRQKKGKKVIYIFSAFCKERNQKLFSKV